jgi:uncharacterized peroxidase-related enzyme
MQIIQPIHFDEATGSARRLLESASNGRPVSNMLKILARSPHALEGYAHLRRALFAGQLSPRLREQIALAVAESNGCEYSVAHHAMIAERLGMTEEEIASSRAARAGDRKTTAALRYARDLTTSGNRPANELREVGYTDGEILEIISQIALNTFENYLNSAAGTELDYPKLQSTAHAA